MTFSELDPGCHSMTLAELDLAVDDVMSRAVVTNSSSIPLLADTREAQFGTKLSSLPTYRIHGQGEPHAMLQLVLRIRGTFVEYWEPPAVLHSIQRSSSAPSIVSTLAEVHEGPSEFVCQNTPSDDRQRLQCWLPPPPDGLPPDFQTYQESPPPATPDLTPSCHFSLLQAGYCTQPTQAPEVSSVGTGTGQNWNVTSAEQATFWQHQESEVPYGWPCQEVTYLPYTVASDSTEVSWMPAQPDGYAAWLQQQAAPEVSNVYGLHAAPQFQEAPHHQQQLLMVGNDSWRFGNDGLEMIMEDISVANFRPQEASPTDVAGYSGPASKVNMRMTPPHAAKQEIHMPVIVSSRIETQKGSRKGFSLRKVPVADERKAWDIIHSARQATVKNQPAVCVWELARQDKHSSANVQDALAIAAQAGNESNSEDGWRDAWALVSGLWGRVRQAYESPFANYVLQQIIEVMPTEIVNCVCEELVGLAYDAARHQFGCRSMIRLIKHHAQESTHHRFLSQVIGELLASAAELAKEQYGTHVVQELLESGLPDHRAAVAKALKGHLHAYSKKSSPGAGRVVEKAFLYCSAVNISAMSDELLSSKDGLRQLVNNEFGIRVVKLLLAGDHAKRAAELLCALSPEDVTSQKGRLLIVEARMIATNLSDYSAWPRRGRREKPF